MKKTLRIVLALVLALSMLAGCGGTSDTGTTDAETTPDTSTPVPAESGLYTPGTYSASADGFGGKVTVTITTSDSTIESIEVDAPDETPTVGGAAVEPLIDAAMEAQSAEIDAYSGATFTSDAFKTALADAIEQAKGGSASADGELGFTAGTYEGTGSGYNGPLTVSVTFTDTAIESIDIVDCSETDQVGTPALDIMIPQMIEANGTGVDAVGGATFSSRALKEAVNAAADEAGVTNKNAFTANTVAIEAGEAVEKTVDVVVVGGGGAGIAAATQAAQDGNTVLVIEKNAQVGGNTLVSGGQYQSVMPYLVWDSADPDATTGEYKGVTYDKVHSEQGCIDELKMIADWSEEPFDADYYVDNEYVAGDAMELSKHGVHEEYLPVLQALKEEIKAYLDWAQPKLDSGLAENQLALFSTLNLHIFQTYYGGLRQSADKTEWIYGDIDLVTQFITDGQDLKPWLQDMGATFKDDEQQTLIGALWYRENEFTGADVDADGDGTAEHYNGRWGTYFMAPMTTMLNANEENEIMVRTTANELIVEDGRVTGVEAEMFDGTPVTAHANKGVILATGGYAANLEEVVDLNIYWSEEYLTTSTKTTNRSSMTGSGIEMAQAAGAATTGMGFTQLMPISWVDNGNLAFGGGNYAVFLNPNTGKRFVDEGSERDVLSLAEFKNGMEVNGTKGVFLEIYNAEQKLPAPMQLPDEGDYEGRYYRRYATEEELGALFAEIGVTADAAAVLETIEKYDQAVMGQGEYPDVGKAIASRTIGNVEQDANGNYDPSTYDLASTLVTVRLMAPSTHHTMGGLKVDIDRHVLDANGEIIPGLYAAGEVTGGIHGGNRLGGNAIVEIFVSGRTAAKAVTADN